MMYVYERMMDQVVQDRHASLAELYDSSQRPGVMASSIGSMLIHLGRWLRQDVDVPSMTSPTQAALRPGG